MKFCLPLIKDKKGVALFIVLTSMATLAIFLGEITYTAQINQKLAYDRLDNVKATALAKSGFRLALLRIRAYSELRKTLDEASKGVAGALVNSVAPKEMIEKIWNEPIIIPFSGDISMLPSTMRDAVEKFRKDSGMEGKLYISVLSQSSKFNLNSYLSPFAPPLPSPSGSPPPTPTATPVAFNPEEARNMLTEQITQTFQKKFDEDETFRDTYRNLKISDLAEDILAWNDLTYDSMRAQSSTLPYKRGPFYDVSELHFLPTVDDQIYNLLAPTYTAGVDSSINVNKIQQPALTALVPSMTTEEKKKFFEFRDKTGDSQANEEKKEEKKDEGGPFKTDEEFFTYLSKNVASFNSPTKVQEFKDSLLKRGLTIVVDESQFLVHIEASVNQTKRTLEAIVTVLKPRKPSITPGDSEPSKKRSSLKVVQMRFL
jgi:type II secretory pathway component PulK